MEDMEIDQPAFPWKKSLDGVWCNMCNWAYQLCLRFRVLPEIYFFALDILQSYVILTQGAIMLNQLADLVSSSLHISFKMLTDADELFGDCWDDYKLGYPGMEMCFLNQVLIDHL